MEARNRGRWKALSSDVGEGVTTPGILPSPYMNARLDLSAAAFAAAECLGVGAADAVLVLTSADQRSIGDAFTNAVRPRAKAVKTMMCPRLSRHGEEPPAVIAEAMYDADVVFAATSHSLSQTQARVHASRRGTRIASLPTITDEIFVRTVPIDYSELKRKGRRLAQRLTAATTARVTSAAGTDITLSIEGRLGRVDDGDLRKPGAFGNLPAGEAYIAPVETVGDGRIILDGSLAGYGVLAAPLTVIVKDGRAIQADGDGATWLLETLEAGGANGRAVAELGIGTNPAATVTGNVLEDEKVIGTVHVAFGSNVGIGGVNVAGVHIDAVMLRPTVELDGEPVLEDE